MIGCAAVYSSSSGIQPSCNLHTLQPLYMSCKQLLTTFSSLLKPSKSFSCGFFFLCGRSPCVHLFAALESGEFAFLSEKTLLFWKKVEGVGAATSRSAACASLYRVHPTSAVQPSASASLPTFYVARTSLLQRARLSRAFPQPDAQTLFANAFLLAPHSLPIFSWRWNAYKGLR